MGSDPERPDLAMGILIGLLPGRSQPPPRSLPSGTTRQAPIPVPLPHPVDPSSVSCPPSQFPTLKLFEVWEILIATPDPFPALTSLPVVGTTGEPGSGVAPGCGVSPEVPNPRCPPARHPEVGVPPLVWGRREGRGGLFLPSNTPSSPGWAADGAGDRGHRGSGTGLGAPGKGCGGGLNPTRAGAPRRRCP